MCKVKNWTPRTTESRSILKKM